MSFNFQGPSEMPIIRGAQSMMNNGGGGNLGYFQGRRKKKEEDNSSIFNTDDEDSFTLSSGEKTEEKFPEENSVTDKLKGFFNKFTKKPENQTD